MNSNESLDSQSRLVGQGNDCKDGKDSFKCNVLLFPARRNVFAQCKLSHPSPNVPCSDTFHLYSVCSVLKLEHLRHVCLCSRRGSFSKIFLDFILHLPYFKSSYPSKSFVLFPSFFSDMISKIFSNSKQGA